MLEAEAGEGTKMPILQSPPQINHFAGMKLRFSDKWPSTPPNPSLLEPSAGNCLHQPQPETAVIHQRRVRAINRRPRSNWIPSTSTTIPTYLPKNELVLCATTLSWNERVTCLDTMLRRWPSFENTSPITDRPKSQHPSSLMPSSHYSRTHPPMRWVPWCGRSPTCLKTRPRQTPCARHGKTGELSTRITLVYQVSVACTARRPARVVGPLQLLRTQPFRTPLHRKSTLTVS
jgi:hypothetical protein